MNIQHTMRNSKLRITWRDVDTFSNGNNMHQLPNHNYEYNIFSSQNPNKTKFIFNRRNLKYPPSHKVFTLLYILIRTRVRRLTMFAGHVYRITRARNPNFRFPYPILCLWTLVGYCVLWMMSIFYFFVHEYSVSCTRSCSVSYTLP